MSALMLVKQADANKEEDPNINSYLIGGSIGALGTGAAAYGIAKDRMSSLNQNNSKLSKELEAQKNAVTEYQNMIESYRKKLEEMGSPDPVVNEINKKAKKPGIFRKVFNASKALFRFKNK